MSVIFSSKLKASVGVFAFNACICTPTLSKQSRSSMDYNGSSTCGSTRISSPTSRYDFLRWSLISMFDSKGLASAKQLRDLNLASNQIKCIGSSDLRATSMASFASFSGTSLADNTELEVLNLADNQITSFQVSSGTTTSTSDERSVLGHHHVDHAAQTTQCCIQ